MLKKLTIRKFLVSMAALMALFLIYLIPKENTYSLKDKTKTELEYVDKEILTETIYLYDRNGFLARTKVAVSKKTETVETKVKELLEVLIRDGAGESKIPNGFKAVIPTDTKILSLNYTDGLLKVNFSKELLEDVKKEEEEKIIEAIVYTVTSIEEVGKVIIYMEGDILNYLPKSKITLPSTLDRSFGINKEYDIKSNKEVTGVTIYYINQYKDDTYYVPVTKYTNDNREKIDIIIDELASAPLYHSNLMSFLNQNVKLLEAEQADHQMNLEFNSYIFNDIDEKNILEEVIYTICLSIGDNYDVEEVSFTVEDEEIYKSVIKTIE
ncbi:MAG: GerMN domain-containing protein [Bacilli bacterium]|nr:GerMN domain-containing protein [Bacilli bacterium]